MGSRAPRLSHNGAHWVAVTLLAVVALLNAGAYPPDEGFDADHHIEYAELVRELRTPSPDTRSEYYTPPLFYGVAAGAMRLGELADLPDPKRLVQILNAALAVATALLVLALARLLWPDRPLLHVAAVGFYAFLPVVLKTAAMFHPETLSTFLATLGIYLAARLLVRRDLRLRTAVVLGLVLGAGQLVRAFGLWTFAVVLLALAFAALARWAPPRRLAVTALVVTLATAVVAGPWYARQALRHGNPVFDQPQPEEPLWERRPLSFYVDPGLPEVLSRPWRPSFTNRALPQTYTELWGDWYGAFAWNATLRADPPAREQAHLRVQQVLGVVPTALAVGGWLALWAAALRRRRPDIALVALLPLAGIAGYLYFTVSYPTSDGDVLKATYMLTTAPCWALAFGQGVDRLSQRRRAAVPLAAVLGAAALSSLAFDLHPLH